MASSIVIVVLRFKYQTELLSSMEKMVKEQKIKNAVILSAIGSVRYYQVLTVSNGTLPSKDMYTTDPVLSGGHPRHERLCHKRGDSRAHDDGRPAARFRRASGARD